MKKLAVIAALSFGLCWILAVWVHASTGAFAGVLERVAPPRYKGPNDPDREQKLAQLHIRTDFVLYQSNTVHRTGELNDTYQLRSDSSPAIDGWLTSVTAFQRALPHLQGHRMFLYEDKHFDLSATPVFTFGRLREFDAAKNRLAISVLQTNLRFHYSENPVLRVERQLDDDVRFMIEPWQEISREQALPRVGRWVQVHPPRKQLVWVESEAAQWDSSHLPTTTGNASRGGANYLTNNAVFHGVVAFKNTRYGGRYTPGIDITTRQDPDILEKDLWGRFVDDGMRKIQDLGDGWVRLARQRSTGPGTTLDQHVVPPHVALRPGRHFAANHYRRDHSPHQRYFQTMNDELMGTIVQVNGRDVTIAVNGHIPGMDTRQQTVTIARDGAAFLDGKPTADGPGYRAGQFIRVFPERQTQTVVFLDEYRTSLSADRDVGGTPPVVRTHPVAYFHADDLVINQAATITFDGRYSYHPEGRGIVRYQWRFGEGSTATGPVARKTFTPQGPFHKELVELTVTDSEGVSDSWIEYVEITDGLLPAQRRPDDLRPGMVGEVWKRGKLGDLSFLDKPGDVAHGIVNWYAFTEKHHGKGSVKRYQGWFEVDEPGQLEFRTAGPSGDAVLLIDGVRVIDTKNTRGYGDGTQPYLQQRARIFLDQGWHQFQLIHDVRTHTLSWNGPGVSWENDYHDVAPIFHTPEQARGVRKRLYWYQGEPSSAGRAIAADTANGIPPRSGKRRIEQ
jgi:hypothetical protein